MVLDGVVLLAAPTPRSQAYVQALVAHELKPSLVILLGAERPAAPPMTGGLSEWDGVALPDLSESVSLSCMRARVPVRHCIDGDVNSPEALALLSDAAPRVLIYSGVGGRIVASPALDLGRQVLHLHSGWLPDYRGSTTIYYALLNGDGPGVTALMLDQGIDTGPMVARKRYSRPPSGMDIDNIYDSAIRADLLVEVMRDYHADGRFSRVTAQNPTEGATHYVIHPVLKHLALLSLAPPPSS